MFKGASGRPIAPATIRETSGRANASAITALFKRQKARALSLAEQPDQRDGEQRQIIVEQESARQQADRSS